MAMMKKYPKSVVFLENYDMTIGAQLTRGSDIWLNNPRRPLEASGTSGMKAAMNGVLNCSILDGWWPEACIDGENGWQIGDGFETTDFEVLDKHDSDALYDTLLNRVLPTYYENREQWVQMMKKSIETTAPNLPPKECWMNTITECTLKTKYRKRIFLYQNRTAHPPVMVEVRCFFFNSA